MDTDDWARESARRGIELPIREQYEKKLALIVMALNGCRNECHKLRAALTSIISGSSTANEMVVIAKEALGELNECPDCGKPDCQKNH